MARYVICEKCRKQESPGQSQPYPGEFKHVVFGTARVPTPQQRTVVHQALNDKLEITSSKEIHLSQGQFDCDYCGGPIFPGFPCACVSVWVGGRKVPEGWEKEYLEEGA